MNRISLTILSCVSLLIYSCNDLIEKDVSNDHVKVISPSDSFVTNTYNVNFTWESIQNITSFRLQIVSPEFNNIQYLVLDTLVNNNKCSYNLLPGRYQWRIRTENSTSHSEYVTRSIKVDTNSDLTNQLFLTNGPIDNEYTNNEIVLFSWQNYPYATTYEYVLTDLNNIIIKNKKTSALSITDTLAEGIYYWKVRATNESNGTSTNYSANRKITIDITQPAIPLPNDPQNNALIPNPIVFTWSRDLSIKGDSLVYSQDSNFLSNNTYIYSTDTFYNAPPLDINSTYYWKIKAIDKAGNISPYSSLYRFTVTF